MKYTRKKCKYKHMKRKSKRRNKLNGGRKKRSVGRMGSVGRRSVGRKSARRSVRKNNFVLGIITVPLSPNKKYYNVCGDSYIASSHLKWMNRNGIDTLIIPHDTTNLKYYFDRIHGLYLPSGGAFAGTQREYYSTCKKLIQMAIKLNDNGYYFPVWGCCMGFQQMLIIADGKDDLHNLLTNFDSFKNYLANIKLTYDGLHSKIITKLDKKTLTKITKKKSTLNNHMLGISPHKFNKNHLLSQFYKIVGTSKDRKGKEFVAIIEGRHYPFYGVQWHPERSEEMKKLSLFFVEEMKKNRKKIKTNKRKKLYTKKINCFNYSEGLYNKCNFYWHKKTSKHNKDLCSYAQLKHIDPASNAI